MTILEVHNLKKVYLGRGRRVCRDHGRVRIGQDNTFEYSGGA